MQSIRGEGTPPEVIEMIFIINLVTIITINRFNSRLVRCLASATFILRQVLTLGVTVYTPSVALNTVIGIPYWISITGLTGISIFFTLLVSMPWMVGWC